jgi:hypothetical protein
MPSFYFLWNPDQFPELEMNQIVQDMATGQSSIFFWNTGSRTKTPFPPGSRAFMVRTGKEPRGVFAYGSIPTGEIFYDTKNWGKDQSGKAPHVEIELERPSIRMHSPSESFRFRSLKTVIPTTLGTLRLVPLKLKMKLARSFEHSLTRARMLSRFQRRKNCETWTRAWS